MPINIDPADEVAVYTKDDVDALLAALRSELATPPTYTASEVDALLATLQSSVYTKTEVDELVAAATAPPAAVGFFDDFNGAAGSKPNPASWSVSSQVSWTGGIQKYLESQVFLDGQGNCVIEAKKATNGDFVSGAFCGKSGPYPKPDSTTLLSWGYGRMEARIKMPKGFLGSWPAWWFLGEEYDGTDNAPKGWPHCGEFDIMEGFSDSTYYHATSHGPGGPNTGGAMNQHQGTVRASDIGVTDFSTDYHVYWCDRRENSMTYGVDGFTAGTIRASDVISPSVYALNKRVFPIFDFMLYDAAGPVDVSKLPARMLIDWVRFTPAA